MDGSRLEDLQEVCGMMCFGCREGASVKKTGDGWMHFSKYMGKGKTSWLCISTHLRDLIEKEKDNE